MVGAASEPGWSPPGELWSQPEASDQDDDGWCRAVLVVRNPPVRMECGEPLELSAVNVSHTACDGSCRRGSSTSSREGLRPSL